jgi:hypothetical protein
MYSRSRAATKGEKYEEKGGEGRKIKREMKKKVNTRRRR